MALKKFLSFRELGIFSTLIILIILFYFTSRNHSFVSGVNIVNLLEIGPEVGIVAIGVSLLMICGEFDLSVGSMLGFSSLAISSLYTNLSFSLPLALFITLCIGAFMGFINGFITVKFNIPSFITTLGTMMWWRGIIYVISAGFPIVFRP
ncbi:MAG: ABC transporter permease, partial [Promethearchaeota archaeon]